MDQDSRSIDVAAADDPALLIMWLHGRLDFDVAGAFTDINFDTTRSLQDVRPGGVPQCESKIVIAQMDRSSSTATATYFDLPDTEAVQRGKCLAAG